MMIRFEGVEREGGAGEGLGARERRVVRDLACADINASIWALCRDSKVGANSDLRC